MLCDRCVLGGRCQSFVPGGECAVESKAYEWVVSELTGQYGLGGLADEILVGRVAMYLIRIARAEVYEANVGVSSASAAWGKYIADLDDSLRVLLRDLALTRAERKKLEKGDVLVDVDRLLDNLAARSVSRRIWVRKTSPVSRLVRDWTVERRRLSPSAKGDQRGRKTEKHT
jgi:hypothetical protein